MLFCFVCRPYVVPFVGRNAVLFPQYISLHTFRMGPNKSVEHDVLYIIKTIFILYPQRSAYPMADFTCQHQEHRQYR